MNGSARATPALTALLVALVAFGPMSVDIYLPSLPEMTHVFNTDVSGAQLTLSVFAATLAAAQLFYGPLSDRYGRRPVLLGGMVIYTIGGLLCLSSTSITALIVFRAVQAFGACAGPVVARAVVRDLFGREQGARMMAMLAAFMSVAPAVAPMIGGLLIKIGWWANFVVMAGFGVVVFTTAYFILGETIHERDPLALRPARIVTAAKTLFRDRVFAGCAFATAFVYVGMLSYVSLASFVLIDVLGVSPQHFGYFFAVPVACFMTGSTVAARLSHRVPLERTMMIGIGIGLISGIVILALALFKVQTVAAVIGPVALTMLGVGLVLPNATAVALSGHPRIAGSASAWLGAMQMGVGSIAGWIAGELFDGTTLILAVFVALGWTVTAVIQQTVLRRARPAV
ncbi:MAG TPA: multidrug effflux MFS transporter [Magnetospirillaceae bacterium]|jgi:DHA1 family bicyclomycin/chloramphenicol resistance-like MFS transporter